MKRSTVLTLLISTVLGTGLIAQAEKKAAPKPQTNCPVMGGKVDHSLPVEVKGQRIYVCCKGCVAQVKADPDKYIAKLKAEGVTPEKIQTKCPVMGGKINKAQYADVNGKRVYVCCPSCIGKVKADPDKYLKKLKAAGVTPEQTPKKKVTNSEHDHAPIKGYAEHEKH